MASYHCSVKVGKKGKAGPHSAYISRAGKYERGREDLVLVATGNMPSWAVEDPLRFWAAADQFERENGSTYREIEVALPRELTEVQNIRLLHAFIRHELGGKHTYQFAIHGDKQPHAHIMYSERVVDGVDRPPELYFKRYNAKHPERGGSRKDSAGTKERLEATRAAWAQVQNQFLERFGHEVRVDHRSLADQGITDRLPSKHLGPDVVAMEQRLGKKSDRRLAMMTRERLYQVERQKEEAKVKAQLMEGVKAEDNLQRQAWRGHLAKRRGVWKEVGVSSLTAQARPGKPLLYRWKSGPAKGMAVMLDYGNRIKAAGRPEAISDTKIRMMISLAREKGWKTICIDGPADFRQRAAVAAARAGLGVQNQDLNAVVVAARMPVAPNRENVSVKAPETPQDAPKEKSKADALATLKNALKAQGYVLDDCLTGRGLYLGKVIQVEGPVAAQDVGRRHAVLHDQAALNRPLVAGEVARVVYREGRGEVQARDHDHGHGKGR